MTTDGSPSPAFGTARCYDRCNACHHVHNGARSEYRCPRCTCSDRFVTDRAAA